MNEKPLERLNYFNGQRLEAADLKTEQDYHIRTRRWLNKSLYSAGIARGLEVRAVPPDPAKQDPPRVGVSLGLAIDDDGREIILLEEALIEVCSYSGTDESTVVGNYLVIEYAEETLAFDKSGGCVVRETGARTSTSTTNFGGPSRVQAKPKFSWIPFPPQPGSNQIVLARVELAEDCATVHQIDTGIRRYIGAASAAKVRQYALEGERELAFLPKELFPTSKAGEPPNADVAVVGRVYFHIRGRQPNSVVLYLRALDMNPLYYTELGRHDHTGPLSGNVGPTELTFEQTKHTHDAKDALGLSLLVTEHEKPENFTVPFIDQPSSPQTHNETLPQHTHWLFARTGEFGVGKHFGFATAKTDQDHAWDIPYNSQIIEKYEIRGTPHRHDIAGKTATGGFQNNHTHSLNGISAAISATGLDLPACGRSGPTLTFVDDLQISIGPASKAVNRTVDIKKQLVDTDRLNWASDPQGTPKTLGDGNSNHVLAISGTGPIRLDFLPDMAFTEGEYCIELSVDAKIEAGQRVANGGKILYNLYIE